MVGEVSCAKPPKDSSSKSKFTYIEFKNPAQALIVQW
jgi:hypothetical protein